MKKNYSYFSAPITKGQPSVMGTIRRAFESQVKLNVVRVVSV